MAQLVFSYPRRGVREGSGSWMGRWGDCGVWAGLQNPKGPGFKYQLKAIRGKSGSATAARSSVVLWLNSLPLSLSLVPLFPSPLPASPLPLLSLTDTRIQKIAYFKHEARSTCMLVCVFVCSCVWAHTPRLCLCVSSCVCMCVLVCVCESEHV